MSNESVVSAPIRQLIEVFSAELPDVAFPGVNAALLAEQARLLEEAADNLASAEEAVAEARRAHTDARAALDTAAERGLGYARVFAADDEKLLEQLESITLRPKPRSRKLPPKRKARRSRSPESNVAELPLGDNRATR